MSNDDEVMVVFTGKSLDACLNAGGTQSWVLNPVHAKHCKYAILCQNAYAVGDWADPKAPHQTAFMIGRISDVVQSTEHPDERWLVKFEEYAPLDIPEFWKGWRNPVRYLKLQELPKELLLSLDNMQFEPMPEAPERAPKSESEQLQAAERLTLPEAKKALAATFGLKPEDIEIIIRG